MATASAPERARVEDLAARILALSPRAARLRDDTRLGKSLGPAALVSIRAPALVISEPDDGFGTCAGAQYTTGRITGARFVGYEQGGHLLVGHDEAVRAAILQPLVAGR